MVELAPLSHLSLFCRFSGSDRTLLCAGVAQSNNSLTTMAVGVNGDYVFVSYLAAPVQTMHLYYCSIRYITISSVLR